MTVQGSSNGGQSYPIDPDHEIDLVGGTFAKTTRLQLDAAFGKFLSGASNHICLFFHGGLVSRQDGLDTAHELVKGYTDAGAYPFFFIWNSDLLTTIHELLHPHEEDRAFVAAANRSVKQVAKKIAEVIGDRALIAVSKNRKLDAPLSLRDLARYAEPFDSAWAKHRGAQLSVSPKELEDIGRWLLALKKQTQLRAWIGGGRIRGPKNPLGRIIERLNSGHGHGLYTTVIEELFIALGVADHLAGSVWGQMKKDIDAAFAPDSDAGGTAFLHGLANAWARKPALKLTLIGHSAGAIYAQRFVEAFDQYFTSNPERRLEVITLAAAVSFERMNQGLASLERRLSGIRVFGLNYRREGGYWEVRYVYNKSLLYIVSSLCEFDPEADRPLVGMRRFWTATRPYDQPYIKSVTKFITSARAVWAPSPSDARPGFQSDAKRHGGMPIEELTNKSVCYALTRGV
jgi:hypothetical protein